MKKFFLSLFAIIGVSSNLLAIYEYTIFLDNPTDYKVVYSLRFANNCSGITRTVDAHTTGTSILVSCPVSSVVGNPQVPRFSSSDYVIATGWEYPQGLIGNQRFTVQQVTDKKYQTVRTDR